MALEPRISLVTLGVSDLVIGAEVQGIRQGTGLLVNFLEHVMSKLAAFGRIEMLRRQPGLFHLFIKIEVMHIHLRTLLLLFFIRDLFVLKFCNGILQR